MFQSFDTKSDRKSVAERVQRLRKIMNERTIAGFFVPRSDEHQGEYVAARSERLAWITGFTGSAGAAIIMSDKARLFVDGRYTLQAGQQTDRSIFEIGDIVNEPPSEWLKGQDLAGKPIGYDPWLLTVAQVKSLKRAAEAGGGELVAVDSNPIDEIWTDQPPAPLEPIAIHPVSRAGVEAGGKLAAIAQKIAAAKAGWFVVTDPSSIAWTFNIRGSDLPHTPFPLGFALLSAEGKHHLFLDKRKMSEDVESYLETLASLHAPAELEEVLAGTSKNGSVVAIDEALCAQRLKTLIEESGGKTVHLTDPAILPRAIKNKTEIDGARAAHRRDGAAMAKFLAWLDRQPANGLDEIGAATRLEEFRVETGKAMQMPLRDISFDTISGFAANGAIVHYRVTRETNRKFSENEIFLVDSGGQYEDGTTDITRTVAIGSPSDEMRERFTLVLKGMIAISRLRFPPKTRGADIDAFARHALWNAGLDYAHGTGHGVGSYLSVHEGPQRIAKTGTEPLKPGMILSNEPGYYKEGAYGIRIENLILVTEPETIKGGDIAMHAFETLTLAPIDRRLVKSGLLDAGERDWLNAYHARVRETIGPLLDSVEDRNWLDQATAPIE